MRFTYGRLQAPRQIIEQLEPRRLFTSPGELDPTFGDGGVTLIRPAGNLHAVLEGVESHSGKTLLIFNTPRGWSSPPQVQLFRLTNSGQRDHSFGKSHDGQQIVSQLAAVTGSVIQPDGRIVLAGTTFSGGPAILRLKADGSPDPGFGVKGVRTVGTGGVLLSPRLTDEGRIVAARHFITKTIDTFSAVRLLPDGRLDPSFGTGGIAVTRVAGFADAVAIQDDGGIVLGGGDSGEGAESDEPHARVMRLTAAGKVDPSFKIYTPPIHNGTASVYEIVRSIDFAPDGKLLLGIEGQNALFPTRLKPDGSEDLIYEPYALSDSFDSSVSRVRAAADGRVVMFGDLFSFTYPEEDRGNNLQVLARWDVDGTLDQSFAGMSLGPVTFEGVQGDIGQDQKIITAAPVRYSRTGTFAVERRLSVGSLPRSAGITKDKQLWIEGTTGDDTILVDAVPAAGGEPAKIRVRINGVVRYFARSVVRSILVEANLGNDTVSVSAFGLTTQIKGGPGNDRLTGGAGNDKITGDAGNDTLIGLAGDDTLEGGAGDDLLDGGTGADVIAGGTHFYPYYGSPGYYLWDGYDTVTYAGRKQAVNVTIDDDIPVFSPVSEDPPPPDDGAAGEADAVYVVQQVIGGAGNDHLSGAPIANRAVTLIGGAGDDVLIGTAFADTLIGGSGHDQLFGRSGDDTLLGRDGFSDLLDGGSGNDVGEVDALDNVRSIERFGN